MDRVAVKHQDKAELNPYVTNLADRLFKVAGKADMKFDSDGWQLLTEVLSYAASAEQRMAEQEERIQQLERVSLTDDLTGIYNRRGLRRVLTTVLANSARHAETGVFAFIDLDNFKAVNDRFGHDAGDAVLRFFVRALRKKLRPSDSIARIAGDEFALILPRCSKSHGIERLRMLQNECQQTPMMWHNEAISIQFSVGVSLIHGGANPDSLISQADAAMYANKVEAKAS